MMRYVVILLALLGGCASRQTSDASANAPLSAEARQVQAELAKWPRPKDPVKGLERPFRTTIQIAGKTTKAHGVLKYYGARDCRLTVVTETGSLLIDARMNWVGVTVLGHAPKIKAEVISMLVRDLSAMFVLPCEVSNMRVVREGWVLRRDSGDGTSVWYTFSPKTARLLKQEIVYGIFDTLRIVYKSYTPAGWPRELTMSRAARLYWIEITFVD